jgi:hypothetical protein
LFFLIFDYALARVATRKSSVKMSFPLPLLEIFCYSVLLASPSLQKKTPSVASFPLWRKEWGPVESEIRKFPLCSLLPSAVGKLLFTTLLRSF